MKGYIDIGSLHLSQYKLLCCYMAWRHRDEYALHSAVLSTHVHTYM